MNDIFIKIIVVNINKQYHVILSLEKVIPYISMHRIIHTWFNIQHNKHKLNELMQKISKWY